MMKKRFIEVDDGLDFSIKHIESGEMFYDCESVVDILNELSDENEQLKTQLQNTSDQRDEFHRGARENANRIGKLEEENEQLKQRNDRQAKQLDRLYQLISEKDWRTLSDILDDFKKAEEQLQRESGTYW